MIFILGDGRFWTFFWLEVLHVIYLLTEYPLRI